MYIIRRLFSDLYFYFYILHTKILGFMNFVPASIT